MRAAFCESLVATSGREDLVFLTGDLGFRALEPLVVALGPRFINAGVAEQNMVSVAAGLARSGLRPWVYSIAPFLYARPCEQIRNDVCLHKLPVVLVGNGGGYGYGVMGATHHALEDYGILLSFPNLRAYVPAFDQDIPAVRDLLITTDNPAYLRLGLSEAPPQWIPPAFAQWRKLIDGDGPTLVAVGPLVGGILAAAMLLPQTRRPSIWVISELPCTDFPEAFLRDVRQSQHVYVVEEHVPWNGAGRMVAELLLSQGDAPRRFTLRAAKGYPSGTYGSQRFHRAESGLDPASVLRDLDQRET